MDVIRLSALIAYISLSALSISDVISSSERILEMPMVISNGIVAFSNLQGAFFRFSSSCFALLFAV